MFIRNDTFQMLFKERFVARCVFQAGSILGKSIADFIKLFRCVCRFAECQQILTAFRILIERVVTLVRILQNVCCTDHSVQIAETVKFRQMKGFRIDLRFCRSLFFLFRSFCCCIFSHLSCLVDLIEKIQDIIGSFKRCRCRRSDVVVLFAV